MQILRRRWFQIFVSGLLLLFLVEWTLVATGDPNYVPSAILLGAFLVPDTFVTYLYERLPNWEVPLPPVAICFIWDATKVRRTPPHGRAHGLDSRRVCSPAAALEILGKRPRYGSGSRQNAMMLGTYLVFRSALVWNCRGCAASTLTSLCDGIAVRCAIIKIAVT